MLALHQCRLICLAIFSLHFTRFAVVSSQRFLLKPTYTGPIKSCEGQRVSLKWQFEKAFVKELIPPPVAQKAAAYRLKSFRLDFNYEPLISWWPNHTLFGSKWSKWFRNRMTYRIDGAQSENPEMSANLAAGRACCSLPQDDSAVFEFVATIVYSQARDNSGMFHMSVSYSAADDPDLPDEELSDSVSLLVLSAPEGALQAAVQVLPDDLPTVTVSCILPDKPGNPPVQIRWCFVIGASCQDEDLLIASSVRLRNNSQTSVKCFLEGEALQCMRGNPTYEQQQIQPEVVVQLAGPALVQMATAMSRTPVGPLPGVGSQMSLVTTLGVVVAGLLVVTAILLSLLVCYKRGSKNVKSAPTANNKAASTASLMKKTLESDV